VVSDLNSEPEKWPIAGREVGHFAGVSALFLKEFTGKFSKIMAVEAFRGS
jgi:hypothetical protein